MNPTLVAEAKKIKEFYQNNPSELQFILHQSPDLAQAVLSDDITALTKFISDSVKPYDYINFNFLFRNKRNMRKN